MNLQIRGNFAKIVLLITSLRNFYLQLGNTRWLKQGILLDTRKMIP